MTPTQKSIIVSRLKSLAWRIGGMAVVFGINWVANNLGMFNLSPTLTILAGLVLGEITKFINVQLQPFLTDGTDPVNIK